MYYVHSRTYTIGMGHTKTAQSIAVTLSEFGEILVVNIIMINIEL